MEAHGDDAEQAKGQDLYRDTSQGNVLALVYLGEVVRVGDGGAGDHDGTDELEEESGNIEADEDGGHKAGWKQGFSLSVIHVVFGIDSLLSSSFSFVHKSSFNLKYIYVCVYRERGVERLLNSVTAKVPQKDFYLRGTQSSLVDLCSTGTTWNTIRPKVT